MITRIEIATRPGLRDPRGEEVSRTVRGFLGVPVLRVRTRDVYRIEADLTREEALRVLAEFADPVLQAGAIGRVEDGPFDVAVTVAYKPGVTDPVGKSARVAVEDTLGRPLGEGSAVFTSTLYLLDGVDRAQAERIAWGLLANSVIETVKVETREEWAASAPDLSVPSVAAHERPRVVPVPLSGSDDELLRISRERLLSLSLAEMRTVRDHFRAAAADPGRREAGLGDAPTDVEIECIAQTWSEHCKHKIFNATVTYREPGRPPETIRSIFKTFIRGATEKVDRAIRERDGVSWLVSVFHDNAGVVAFDHHVSLVYKVETHNSPSALDPYGGAITGIVGVNRDPFGTGLGADLLANVWGYCFASPFHDGPVPKGLLHPRRIRDGVHRGVIDGGNQSGIPYARGFEVFDARYLGKPLVFCGTVGALPVSVTGRPGHVKKARPGDLIVMTGGRIGADGIHGATFSSAALDESSPVQAVQIGDPITQKRMFDFLLEARDLGLYEAITDNGAGGLSSSVGEMARGSGGARIDLARAPLKYAGLAPWEILLSEAQERMTLAVAPEKIGTFLDLARRREVEATVLGEFTSSGRLHVTYGDETAAVLDMEFLYDGNPDLDLDARWTPPSFPEPPGPPPGDLTRVLRDLLGRLNLCSGEAKARYYDHEVKGLSVVKPFTGTKADVPAEGTVLLARHGSVRGYVLSEGIHPFLSDIDAHAMAALAVDEAVRRQLAAGARLDWIALLDNFCWPDPVESESTPDGAYKMAQLVRACRGLHDLSVAYGTPLISGKDSMKNDSTMGGVKISVPPTLLVSAIGRIDDVREAVTLDLKAPGDAVFLVGTTRDDTGASEYLRYRGDLDGLEQLPGGPRPYVGNKAPRVDPAETVPLYRAFDSAVRQGLVRSACVPTRGGLAAALGRAAMAGELGLDLDLDRCPDLVALPADVALFSESCGRFVATTSEDDAATFQRRFDGLACQRIGTVTTAPRILARLGGRTVLDADVFELKASFKATLREDKGEVDGASGGSAPGPPLRAPNAPEDRRILRADHLDGIQNGGAGSSVYCEVTIGSGGSPLSPEPMVAGGPGVEPPDARLDHFCSLSEDEKDLLRASVRVLILTGLGLNCEAETEAAFRTAGARPERVHLLDLLDGRAPGALSEYQVLAFVGGFAFGDHLGAGSVFANKIRWRLYDRLLEFIARGGLALGICNGFQTMVRLGMLPGFDGDYRTPRATLAPNDRLGYRDAWVRLLFDPRSPCVWTRGLGALDLPARHGEGKFLVADEEVLARLESGRQVAARYVGPDGRPSQEWPWNPNGSPGAVAGICDPSGRLFGLMPHPDAFLYAFQHPRWFRRGRDARGETAGRGFPEEGGGIAIFRNGVDAAAAGY